MDKPDSLDFDEEELDDSLSYSELSEEVDSYEGWNVISGWFSLNYFASFAHSISLISNFNNFLSIGKDSSEWFCFKQ